MNPLELIAVSATLFFLGMSSIAWGAYLDSSWITWVGIAFLALSCASFYYAIGGVFLVLFVLGVLLIARGFFNSE